MTIHFPIGIALRRHIALSCHHLRVFALVRSVHLYIMLSVYMTYNYNTKRYACVVSVEDIYSEDEEGKRSDFIAFICWCLH